MGPKMRNCAEDDRKLSLIVYEMVSMVLGKSLSFSAHVFNISPSSDTTEEWHSFSRCRLFFSSAARVEEATVDGQSILYANIGVGFGFGFLSVSFH